ncbi:sugar ABC transporter substrate-binding protein [Acidisoma cellulosilytica]|uniref:Sugar ABC transporter substrate-binding protein n=1 Tax=Acidisoma cellulosilyticum TaxID=2802395 RepID=A0A963Z3W3_9PROT|nr:sugar ABC transporter substrate-binding protein [Acidisoma cellulosilyticum]MCB8882051.1 sugar ABC transporter substrate-binding protein [Acidisoma cellulosilyticum]
MSEEEIIAAAFRLKNPQTRRVFIKLAAAAGIAIPTGAAGIEFASRAQAAAKGKIAAQFATLANDYWAAFAKGFHATCEELQIGEVELLHDNDAARELSQVRGLPIQSVSMLINTVVAAGEVPMVARICQQNSVYYTTIWEIPAWFTPPDVGDYFVSYNTSNSVQAGYEVAKVLFKSIGGEGTVVHIKGLATPTDDARTAGMMKAAGEFPGIKIVGGLRADWVREKARSVMLSMVTAYPDMKGVFAQNDSMALGVLSVLKERNLTSVKVAGIDGLPEGLAEVAKGGQFVATNTSLPPYQAGFAAVLLFDAYSGWKPSLPERLIYTGSLTATVENAESINQKIYASAKLPFDWLRMSRSLHPNDWDPQNKVTPIDPVVHWAGMPNEARLNAAYKSSGWAAELAATTQLYAERYKTGPFHGG